MVDIHSHIIPGVDDGSESMEMTLSLMLRAYDQGVRVFFATPHSSAFQAGPGPVHQGFQALRSQASRFFPDASLFLGCEIKCEDAWMDEILAGLHTGKYPTLTGTKYVLVEFSHWVMPPDTLPCLEKLVQAGWIPVIAHMERYVYLRDRPELVDRFRQLGCLIQINVSSLSEETDANTASWARQLVLNRQADFLGTDMHRTYNRPPSITRGLAWLYENCGQDYGDALSFGNAQRLLWQSRPPA